VARHAVDAVITGDLERHLASRAQRTAIDPPQARPGKGLAMEPRLISRRNLILGTPAAAALGASWVRAAMAARNPVACQTNAWQIKLGDFNELLSRVADLKSLGFEAFECNVRFVQGQFANAGEARARLEQTGVQFYGPHVGLGFPVEQIETMVTGSAALGAGHLALSGQGKLLTRDGRLDQDALKAKVEAINRLARHCEARGVRLAYHNHTQEFAAGGAEIEGLLERTDPERVWLLLDMGHAYNAKADVIAFFKRHHHRIDAMHLRHMKNGKQVPLGEGELDFGSLAAAIRETSWPGYLTLEEESLKTSDARQVETVLRSSRQQIRKFFGA
jgi:sugar phosphate isomerase/epimerase